MSNDLIHMPARIAPHLTLRAMLGEGGTAKVYEAFHERLGLSVAVKLFAMDGENTEHISRRLVREARICARLTEPFFPHVYDVGTLEDGRPYVVMEFLDGKTLEATLDAHPLPVSEAVGITRTLLDALEALHDKGIIHRDVKPANVLLEQGEDGELQVRLMDFGIAHVAAEAEPTPKDAPSTQHGQIFGTPGYMAPEQICGDDIDGRTDLYALGVTLYEMLTGELPIESSTLGGMLRRPLHEDVPDVRTLAEDVPKAVAEWIQHATARDPKARFASAAEARAALERAVSPRRRLRIDRISQGILAAAAIGVVWLSSQPAESTTQAAVSPLEQEPVAALTDEAPGASHIDVENLRVHTEALVTTATAAAPQSQVDDEEASEEEEEADRERHSRSSRRHRRARDRSIPTSFMKDLDRAVDSWAEASESEEAASHADTVSDAPELPSHFPAALPGETSAIPANPY